MKMNGFPVIDPEATGMKLKSLMKEKGFSVEAMRKEMGLANKSTLYKWFRGEALPSIDNLLALGTVLGTGVDGLIVTKRAA